MIHETFSAFRPKPPKPVRSPVTRQKGHNEEFTPDEEMVLRRVLKEYSAMPFGTLTRLTHMPGIPWDQVRKHGYYARIPNRVMEEYFAGLLRQARKHAEREKDAQDQPAGQSCAPTQAAAATTADSG